MASYQSHPAVLKNMTKILAGNYVDSQISILMIHPTSTRDKGWVGRGVRKVNVRREGKGRCTNEGEGTG